MIFYGGDGMVLVDSGLPYTGVIYATTPDGKLLWYRDSNRRGENASDASTGWAPNSGKQIGQGWHFRHLFGGGDGIIYAITDDGRLLWYRDDSHTGENAPDGSTHWAANSGKQIGQGWDFRQVFHTGAGGHGFAGHIYAITEDGRLLWYKDTKRDGTNNPDGSTGWAPNSGRQIGQGWSFEHVFAIGTTIYAITSDGRLLWYRDDDGNGGNASDGSTGWAANSGAQIGQGWYFATVFAGGFESGTKPGNIIYAVTDKGQLLWYRDDKGDGGNAPDGSSGWAANSGRQIGQGWIFP